MTIPRAMIEAFPETYHWDACAGSDCPMSSALRYRSGAVEVGGGTLSLLVGSEVRFYVVHPAPE